MYSHIIVMLTKLQRLTTIHRVYISVPNCFSFIHSLKIQTHFSLSYTESKYKKMGIISLMTGWPGPSGFGSATTAEQVTAGIDAGDLTVLITGNSNNTYIHQLLHFYFWQFKKKKYFTAQKHDFVSSVIYINFDKWKKKKFANYSPGAMYKKFRHA